MGKSGCLNALYGAVLDVETKSVENILFGKLRFREWMPVLLALHLSSAMTQTFLKRIPLTWIWSLYPWKEIVLNRKDSQTGN
jgi:hypothetical protein